MPENIKYPRKLISRWLLKRVGRLLLRVLFKLEILGRENLPQRGPFIVVGNHTAALEAVLMNVCTPWQIEMLGAADIPHELISQIFMRAYGLIPIRRGHFDRTALQTAVNILQQGGIVGIFPEGGIWEPGEMKAQSGVAWLSFRGKAPVLPIGFSHTFGALNLALQFKRPAIEMRIGDVIAPIQIATGTSRKKGFADYSRRVMAAVRALMSADDISHQVDILNEQFELKIQVKDLELRDIPAPPDLIIKHDLALTKLLHRPAILKLFRKNLALDTASLENLDRVHDPQILSNSLQQIIDYLENHNPYLLTYRFGPKTAENMYLGLKELAAVAQWANDNQAFLYITPIRRYFSQSANQEIVQTKQGNFSNWM